MHSLDRACPPRSPRPSLRCLALQSVPLHRQPYPRHRRPLPPCRSPVRGPTRLRGLAPPGSPIRCRTVADAMPPRGSPGVPSLPSHCYRSVSAFRRRPDHCKANPARDPDPFGVRFPRSTTLPSWLRFPGASSAPRRPKARASSPTNRPRGTSRARPAHTAPCVVRSRPMPEGGGVRGTPRPPCPRSSVCGHVGCPKVPVWVR